MGTNQKSLRKAAVEPGSGRRVRVSQGAGAGGSADSRSQLKVGKNLVFLKYNFTHTKFALYSKINEAPMIWY